DELYSKGRRSLGRDGWRLFDPLRGVELTPLRSRPAGTFTRPLEPSRPGGLLGRRFPGLVAGRRVGARRRHGGSRLTCLERVPEASNRLSQAFPELWELLRAKDEHGDPEDHHDV